MKDIIIHVLTFQNNFFYSIEGINKIEGIIVKPFSGFFKTKEDAKREAEKILNKEGVSLGRVIWLD